MFKKKLLAVAAAAASLALVVPAFSFSATAANGDLITVGGQTVKLSTDFENLADGLVVGQNGDTVFASAGNTDDNCVDCHIQSGMGVDGSKGLVFGVEQGISNNGVYFNESYKYPKDPNPVVDYEGATDFVFWIDATAEPQSQVAIQIVLTEWDYDASGNPVMTTDPDTDAQIHQNTSRIVKNTQATDANAAKYYLLQQDGTWTECAGTDSNYVRIPNTFKGYVRIPLSDFQVCWGTKDADNKFDLKHMIACDFFTGLYPRHVDKGYMFVADNFGFAGSFAAPTTTTVATTTTTVAPTTTTVAPTTTTAVPTTTTVAPTTVTEAPTTASPTTVTTESSASTTAAPTTAATTAAPTTKTSTVTTAAPTTSATAAADVTTNAPSDTTSTSGTQNPQTGASPITAAMATAVVFAGVLVAFKKRSK